MLLITILKIIGIVLLVLLGLLVLVLSVPIRYETAADLEDPVPGEEKPDYGLLFREHASGSFRFSWFGPLVRGGISWPGADGFLIRILFWKWDVLDLIRHKPERRSGKEPDTVDRQPASVPEKVSRILKKAKKQLSRVRYVLQLLSRPSGERARKKIGTILGRTLPGLLPRQWKLTGTVGLGDPQAGGRICEGMGILYPFTEEHIAVSVRMMDYQMDLHLRARGRVRLWSLLRAALSLVLDRDIRRLIHGLGRLRHKSSGSQRSRHLKKDTAVPERMEPHGREQ